MTRAAHTITMKTLAAGPAGTFEEGRTYRVGDQVPRELAEQLLTGGYAVSGESETPPPAPADPEADKPLEKYTVEQLKAFAAEHKIDLGDAAKKAELLDAITTELARREAEADDNGGDGGGS
ncbi:hypothetical protein OIA45_39740 [Streptomyces chartreusis]|uniref:hypothetical protein n=1 Tax=Streptomyces chartreusis TaxID=1969 RepID=UPI003866AC63|nr:hypothetical protein OIA45_39740 [Streptomyces chartreusis]